MLNTRVYSLLTLVIVKSKLSLWLVRFVYDVFVMDEKEWINIVSLMNHNCQQTTLC